MHNAAEDEEKTGVGRLFIPALIIAFFSATVSVPILLLLTVNFAETFLGSGAPAAIGLASQAATLNGLGELVFALFMGFLAVRFRHKALLLTGIVFVAFSAVGNFFAPTLAVLQVFFALEGIGTTIVAIMGYTMIGEYLPVDKKPKVVSYVVAATSLATLVGTPLIWLLTNVAGWRSVFLFLSLPICVAGLAMTFIGLPSRRQNQQSIAGKQAYLSIFKQVLANRSSASCLIGGLIVASSGGTGIYAIAFYRQNFLVPMGLSPGTVLGYATGIAILAAAMYVVASLVVGRFVNRVGAKKLTVASLLGNGVLLAIFFFMPNLWVMLAVDMIHVWFQAAAFTSYQCLALDQVPNARGTMMSLKSFFSNLGQTISPAVGGAILVLLSSYQTVGVTFGALSICAGVVLLFLTQDPNRKAAGS